MTKEEILKGEGSHLEFKQEIPEKKENFLKTVSAFSNTSGGTIVFGIDDKTHTIKGLEGDIFKLMDSIINAISDNIEPLISPEIFPESIDGKTVIILNIFPTNYTPCFLKVRGKENGTFVRIGATTRAADFYALRELELNGVRTSFDSQKNVNLMNDKAHFNADVTKKLCMEIQKRIKREGFSETEVTEKTLESLGVLKNINGELFPTNAYALLTLSDFYDFSRCSVRCACFRGVDKTVFLDKFDCSGPIFEQVEQALKFVLKNIKVGIRFVGLQGLDDYEIPVNALREAIVNAVVHRSYMIEEPVQIAIYDDRIEIISPGRLVPGLSLESALNGKSVSRNPVIAKVFRIMDFMEEWGSGFGRINQECKKAGIKAPEFIENESDCSLVFKRIVKNNVPQGVPQDVPQGVPQDLDGFIINEIKMNNKITREEIARKANVNPKTVARHIEKLKDKVHFVGSGFSGHWQIKE